jgi:hypothetical protein
VGDPVAAGAGGVYEGVIVGGRVGALWSIASATAVTRWSSSGRAVGDASHDDPLEGVPHAETTTIKPTTNHKQRFIKSSLLVIPPD